MAQTEGSWDELCAEGRRLAGKYFGDKIAHRQAPPEPEHVHRGHDATDCRIIPPHTMAATRPRLHVGLLQDQPHD